MFEGVDAHGASGRRPVGLFRFGWKAELAWSAGLFNADGCIVSLGPGSISVLIARASWNGRPQELERLRQALARGRIRRAGVHVPRGSLYLWEARGPHDARIVLEMLWPWLTDQRRRQALDALERCGRDAAAG